MRQRSIPKRYTEELLDILQKSAKSPAFLDGFLHDLLTPGEYDALAIRWQIVKLLADGLTQREITERLHISIATVTRGSRELYDKHGAFAALTGFRGSHKMEL